MDLDLTDGIDAALLSELGWDQLPWEDFGLDHEFGSDENELHTPDDSRVVFYFPEDFSLSSTQTIWKYRNLPCDLDSVMRTLTVWDVPITKAFWRESEQLSSCTLEECLRQASLGDAASCLVLGAILAHDSWSDYLAASAFRDGRFLIHTAAELGHSEAAHLVASIDLESWLSADKRYASRERLRLLRRAERYGLIEEYSLIQQLWERRHIPDSCARNVSQLHLFAETGFTPAIHELAEFLYLNYPEQSAMYWLRESAQRGNPRALSLISIHEGSIQSRRRRIINNTSPAHPSTAA
jgi:hypothetical protein